MLRLGSAVILIAMGAGLLGACSEDQSAEASLCDSLGDLRTAVGELRALDAGSSREDFEQARDAVLDAWDSVVEDAGDVAGARTDVVESAISDLRTALDDLPDNATLRERLSAIEPEVTAINFAVTSLFSGLECDS